MPDDLSEAATSRGVLPKSSRFNPTISVPRSPFGVLQGLAWAIVVALGFTVLVAFLAGFYARPLGDDYSFAMTCDQKGFFGAVYSWWAGYLGRWFAISLLNITTRANFLLFPLVSPLAMVVWALGLYRALAEFLGERREALPLVAVLLGGTLAIAPNQIESLYWICAFFFHTGPLVMSGWGVWMLLRRQTPLWVVAPFFLCLAGSSETFGVTIAPVMVALALWRRDKVTVVACLCFLVGAALVFLAPGNAVRSLEFHVRDRSAAHVLERSWMLGSLFWSYALGSVVRIGAAATFILGLTSRCERRPRWFVPLWGLAFAFYCAVVTQVPSVYGLGHIPDGRTMISTAFLISGGLLFAALTAGLWARPFLAGLRAAPSRLTTGLALVLTVFGCLQVPPALSAAMQIFTTMHHFSGQWAERDASIREQVAAGKKVVTVDAIALISVDLRSAPKYYVNEFTAFHYDRSGKTRIVTQGMMR